MTSLMLLIAPFFGKDFSSPHHCPRIAHALNPWGIFLNEKHILIKEKESNYK